jgi:hypothetical protein
MDVCVCVYSVYRSPPSDGLITRQRSPTVSVENDYGTEEEARGSVRAVRAIEKKGGDKVCEAPLKLTFLSMHTSEYKGIFDYNYIK